MAQEKNPGFSNRFQIQATGFPSPPSTQHPSTHLCLKYSIGVSWRFTFASLPRTERGQPIVLGSDPKGENLVYTHGNRCILLSDPSGTDLSFVFFSFFFSSFFSFSFSSSHLALLLLFTTSTCMRPPNPYIFWKLMIIAIQKRIGNTNTKTKTNTKTMTKTKTQREQLNHQCAIFSEPWRLKHSTECYSVLQRVTAC